MGHQNKLNTINRADYLAKTVYRGKASSKKLRMYIKETEETQQLNESEVFQLAKDGLFLSGLLFDIENITSIIHKQIESDNEKNQRYLLSTCFKLLKEKVKEASAYMDTVNESV